MFPDWSTARTAKACNWSASGPMVSGDAHPVKAAALTEHSNVEASSAENSKVGVALLVSSPGPEVIVVSGAVVSAGSNVAWTVRSSSRVTWHAPAPLQSPDHPAKNDPAVGVAVRSTVVPSSYDSLQSLPQSIPAGSLVIVPAPAPIVLAFSRYVGTETPLPATMAMLCGAGPTAITSPAVSVATSIATTWLVPRFVT